MGSTRTPRLFALTARSPLDVRDVSAEGLAACGFAGAPPAAARPAPSPPAAAGSAAGGACSRGSSSAPSEKAVRTASTDAVSTRASGPSMLCRRAGTRGGAAAEAPLPNEGARTKPAPKSGPQRPVVLKPRHAAVGHVVGQAFHEVVLVGDEVHRAAQHVEQLRVALLGAGHDLVAHVGAEAVSVGVGGVFAPEAPLRIARDRLAAALAFLHVGAQLLAARVHEGPRDRAVGVAHGPEAAGAGAHDGAHVEAFHAVVGRVRREDAPVGDGCSLVLAQAAQGLVGGKVALVAGHRLHVAARALRLGRHVDLAQEQRDVQKLGQARHEARVGIGVGAPQPMVHVQHGQRAHQARRAQFAGHVGQRRGIRPARHHEQHGRLAGRQPSLAHGIRGTPGNQGKPLRLPRHCADPSPSSHRYSRSKSSAV